MKKMMAALALAGVGVMFADVAVTDVKVQPRTPWNGLVDVEYTLACDDPEADVYVNPVGYDGDRRITLFPQAFTGDSAEGPVKAGKHTLVWDAVKDFGHAFSCANFQLKFYAGKRLAPYVVIDISRGSTATNYPVRFSMTGPDITRDTCRTNEIWMRLVPPGEFWMGSPTNELGRSDNEDLHHVTFTKPFYMGVFEVTQGQWRKVYGSSYSYFSGSVNSGVRPVEQTSLRNIRGIAFEDTLYLPNITTSINGSSFISLLRIRTGNGTIDLPPESQWEYACRAGTTTALSSGCDLTGSDACGNLTSIARYNANGYNNRSYSSSSVDVGTIRVGNYAPNALGLYDMIGNVSELCCDFYADHLGHSDIMNPNKRSGFSYSVSSSRTYSYKWHMVMRGGGWKSVASSCRSAYRGDFDVVTSSMWYSFSSSSGGPSGKSEDSCGFRLYSDASF